MVDKATAERLEDCEAEIENIYLQLKIMRDNMDGIFKHLFKEHGVEWPRMTPA